MRLTLWRVAIPTASLTLIAVGAYFELLSTSTEGLPSLLRSLTHSSLCQDHTCLDLSGGVQILDGHVSHIAGIWELIESMGQPGFFTPTARRLQTDTSPMVYRDTKAKQFLDLISNFCLTTILLEELLSARILSTAIDGFSRSMLNPLLRTRGALLELEELKTRHDSQKNPINRRLLEIETDTVLNATATMLIEALVTVCNATLDQLHLGKLVPLAQNASSFGSELNIGLEPELSRAQEALRQVPWWDTWTPAHWAGVSNTAQLRAYQKFLKKERETFPPLADAASAISDNLEDLRDYCLWYLNNDTIPIIHRSRGQPLTVKTTIHSVENLRDRIRMTTRAQQDPEVVAWPPRRVRSLKRIS
ncbi:hypothetical protein C8J57DRAFT_1305579 [Mycena rebaudengoi]|nr:hypothetical protein C8J57DRAFT_1305579 [Mycena rebaudengoi]